MRNNFGLTERDMKTITGILNKFTEVDVVNIFGSRAKGTFKEGSDIDLVIMNKSVSEKTLKKIQLEFEDSSLPYTVDLVCFDKLHQQEFIDHINRISILFYKKQ